MMLFSLCVHAMLRNFEQKLPGSRFGKRAHKTVVKAYADNITILPLHRRTYMSYEAIQCYEKATGARLNTRKSKALAVGGWSTTTSTLGIPYA